MSCFKNIENFEDELIEEALELDRNLVPLKGRTKTITMEDAKYIHSCIVIDLPVPGRHLCRIHGWDLIVANEEEVMF